MIGPENDDHVSAFATSGVHLNTGERDVFRLYVPSNCDIDDIHLQEFESSYLVVVD